VLTGSPEELAQRCAAWGYDGIELLPDPENIPDPEPYQRALENEGVKLYVVNSGRVAAQGMAQSDEDASECPLTGNRICGSRAGGRSRIGGNHSA